MLDAEVFLLIAGDEPLGLFSALKDAKDRYSQAMEVGEFSRYLSCPVYSIGVGSTPKLLIDLAWPGCKNCGGDGPVAGLGICDTCLTAKIEKMKTK